MKSKKYTSSKQNVAQVHKIAHCLSKTFTQLYRKHASSAFLFDHLKFTHSIEQTCVKNLEFLKNSLKGYLVWLAAERRPLPEAT